TEIYSERGPALGLDAKYAGGFIMETRRQPWDFDGDFKSYFLLDDTGRDNLGGDRRTITPPQTFRGHIQWQHQHFFPNDWQAPIRAAYMLTLVNYDIGSSLKCALSHESLAHYGFRNPKGHPFRAAVLPGLPSIGMTGVTHTRVYRADLPQHIDWPFSAGQFRLVPYVM